VPAGGRADARSLAFGIFELRFVLGLLRQAAGVPYSAVRRIGFTGSTATGRRLARLRAGSSSASSSSSAATNPLIVLADADLGYAVDASAETFGRVAAIEVVDSADEAVQRANAPAYGLSAGILTGDADRGLALAQRLETGIVHVNDQPVADEPQMPFGGVEDSGYGRYGGQATVDDFTELRWITVRSGPHAFPF